MTIETTDVAAGGTRRCPRTDARRRMRQGLVGAVGLGLVAGLGMTAEAAAAPSITPAREVVQMQSDGRLRVEVADGSGATGTVVLGLDDDRFTEVTVEALVNGQRSHEVFSVDQFVLTGGENFQAELRAKSTATVLEVDSQSVTQQVLPVLFILGLLARLGIRWVIRWYGRAQIKKAVKSYLLNNINANKWNHIMQPRHNWGAVGARSREEVAELMGRAMAEGRHSPYKFGDRARQAQWAHRGRTVVVTYNKQTGQISDGWVPR